MTKPEIRKFIKEILVNKKDTLLNSSQQICKKIMESDDFINADYIFAYSALKDEVDLTSVINKAFELNKKVALPKITVETSTMDFCEISKEEFSQLKEGYCGIMEPEKAFLDINNISKNILILTPGRAFTMTGKRLGRGKGFYDRYFSNISKKEIKKMGVCFDFQVVTELPIDEFDICMDGLFTN